MTDAARRTTGDWRPVSGAVCGLLLAWLAGCSLLPLGGGDADAERAEAPADAASAALEPARYRVEVEAPDDLRKLLLEFLDISRFQNAPATDAITAPELTRLAGAAPAQARALLETEGYFNPEVTIARHDAAGDLPVLQLHVRPGPRTTVSRVEIGAKGALEAAPDELAGLRRDWPLRVGKPFRQPDWSGAKSSSLARVRAEGYPAANWDRTDAVIDAVRNDAKLALTVDSGPLFKLGELQIEGVQRYDEEAIRRLATFAPGDPYKEKLLLDFQERLQKAGLFEAAAVEIDPDPAQADATPVQVRVRELPKQQATFGVGVSANTGPRMTLEHVHRRPFGWRWMAKNKFELGRDLNSWQGDLTSYPLGNQYRNLIGGTAERLKSTDEVRTSWSARVGRAQETEGIDRLYFAEFVHARVETPVDTTRSDAVSANYHWVFRDVDSVLLPTRGTTLALQTALGLARSEPAANGPFGRGYARFTWYRPVGSWYAIARVEAGQVFARDAVGVPDTLLFRAGGDDSVRGYAYRTLAPTVNGVLTSGRVLLTGSAEIARPISRAYPAFWWAAFVDAGNAAQRWSDLEPALGYGVGLRWRSPVGPLRLDLAYGEEVKRFRVHLSVGIAF